MPLELINLGVEPNDGTGDPPRVAGLKINANFEELYQAVDAIDYGPAIATLTTDVATLETSQAGQDAAIAALALDVAALESAPQSASGWDYIGPTEPIGPAVDFTWWEKPAQKRWFWTGSVWAAVETTPIPFNAQDLSTVNSVATGPIYRSSQLPFIRTMAVSLRWSSICLPTADIDNRWEVALSFGSQQNLPSISLVGTLNINSPQGREGRSTPLTGLSDGVNEVALYAVFTKVGNPSPLTWGGAALVREVRV